MTPENSEQSLSEVSEPPLSPLSPSKLIDLYFRPRKFFSDTSSLSHRSALVISAVLMGIAGAKGRIDMKILQAELSQANNGWDLWPLSSWAAYWLVVVMAGLLGAVFLWYLGGWWYKKRLQWSGAKDASSILARRIYTMQELVLAAPSVLFLLFQTVLFSNYHEAWLADRYWSSAIMVFAFWSCWTSYTAAITTFSVSKTKARIWFLVLPGLLYIVAPGVIGILYALFFIASLN